MDSKPQESKPQEPKIKETKDIVLYHKGCTDGFTAAVVAQHYYTSLCNNDAVPKDQLVLWCTDPQETHLQNTINKLSELYTPESNFKSFDVAFGQKSFDLLLSKFPNARVWDHHITTQKDCAAHPQITFDNDRSGAMLAWNHYFPQRDAPALVRYVQDRDLWKWALPKSHEVSSWLYNNYQPFYKEMARWLELLTSEAWLNGAMEFGNVILKYEANMVAGLGRKSVLRKIDEHIVRICESPVLRSELGDYLYSFDFGPEAAKCDYVLIWCYDMEKEAVYVSLRSNGKDPKAADVEAVAKKRGGGGHKNAAGFEMPLPDFMKLISEKIGTAATSCL